MDRFGFAMLKSGLKNEKFSKGANIRTITDSINTIKWVIQDIFLNFTILFINFVSPQNYQTEL